jgi:hypothetical protein
VHFRHEAGTDTARLVLHALDVCEDRDTSGDDSRRDPWPGRRSFLGPPPSWIALPVGRAEAGPSIAELVQAVRDAGGMAGGEALFDPRYEPEMRRFLIRALEMEGIPVPRGGGTP